jgi:hypothetical protein
MKEFEIRRGRPEDAEAIEDVHLDSRCGAMPWLPLLHSCEDAITYFTDQVLLHGRLRHTACVWQRTSSDFSAGKHSISVCYSPFAAVQEIHASHIASVERAAAKPASETET